MFKNQTHYSIARFDGALMYEDLRAGLMTTGITKSPIVQFKVKAGMQFHPAWAIDELAVEIYCYVVVARQADVGPNHLQASFVASWVSAETCSNLIVTNVEWHTSMKVREASLRIFSSMMKKSSKSGPPAEWPEDIITIPVVERS